uniref:Uncharacterized protein n=1 Tax=Arundo donax TaxID=35708 RepID=A0A0A9FKP2_ARUDO
MYASTAVIMPACKHCAGCLRDIFSNACKHCSATSRYSMARRREQITGRRPWRTTASEARGMASQRYVMARKESSITSGLAPASSPPPPPPASRTSARAAASVGM